MTKTCAAHDIGMDGFGFVAMVAMQWDAIRYNRPVSYHIGALMMLLGIISKDSFYRIEKRCIASGWLKKRNQGTRKTVLYWVEIPERFGEIPDTPTEDGDLISHENVTNGHANPGLMAIPIPDQSQYLNRTHNSTPSTSSSSLSLNPIPVPSDEAGGAEPDSEKPRLSDRELIRPLTGWVRWKTSDPEQSADNLAELVGLIREHGAQVIEIAAKTGFVSTATKLWPNEIIDWLPQSDIEPPTVNTQVGWSLDVMIKSYPVIAEAVKLIEERGWEWARDLWRYTPEQMPDHAAAMNILRTDVTASEELVRKAQAIA